MSISTFRAMRSRMRKREASTVEITAEFLGEFKTKEALAAWAKKEKDVELPKSYSKKKMIDTILEKLGEPVEQEEIEADQEKEEGDLI